MGSEGALTTELGIITALIIADQRCPLLLLDHSAQPGISTHPLRILD